MTNLTIEKFESIMLENGFVPTVNADEDKKRTSWFKHGIVIFYSFSDTEEIEFFPCQFSAQNNFGEWRIKIEYSRNENGELEDSVMLAYEEQLSIIIDQFKKLEKLKEEVKNVINYNTFKCK